MSNDVISRLGRVVGSGGVWVLSGLMAAGCHGGPAAPEGGNGRAAAVRAALTPDGQRIIGFENPPADWTLLPPATSIPAPVASPVHTQGSFSMSVQARGYVPVQSATFPVTNPVTGPITFDFQLPLTQPNPSWLGAVQLYIDCRPLGIYNAYVGQKELTGQPLGKFFSESFDLPSSLTAQLANGCSALSFTIGINVPTNASGAYLVDNLRFGGSETVTPLLSCVGDLDSSGNGSHRFAIFGYDSTATADVTIPIGAQNQFTPGPADRAQPRIFHPGHHAEAVSLAFGEEGLAWQLGGVTAAADLNGPACAADQVTRARAMRQAQRAVTVLRSISDRDTREYVSALVLNLQAAFNEVAGGVVGSEIERRIATYAGTLDATSRAFLATLGRGLPFILPEVRAELLGSRSSLDPSNGNVTANLQALGVSNSDVNPRLRQNFCAQPDSSVTTGIVNTGIPDPDSGIGLIVGGGPIIKGVQRNTVSSPHPVLVTDHDTQQSSGPSDEGNGFSASGVVTSLHCPCDATQGLICSTQLTIPPGPADPNAFCVAFPIVTQGQDFTLRGYNFWDPETAAVVLKPVLAGNGGTASFVAHTAGVDTSGANRDCMAADKTNETHDTASFRTEVSPGFYRIRLFNQNGKYRLRGEPPDAPGRTVHVCWKLPLPDGRTFPPEPTTDLNCDPSALATDTCAADGAPCPASIWGTPPRLLANCTGSVLDPPKCGETPAWVGSEPHDRPGSPIVYVQQGVPNFQIQVYRQSVEAVDESGWDILGSDETQVILAAFTDRDAKNGLSSLDELKRQAGVLGPDDYDSGTRRVFTPAGLLSQVNAVGQDEAISFGLEFLEIDCQACIIGVVGAIGAALTAGLCAAVAPACPAITVGGTILTGAVIAIIAASDVNDNMGVVTWTGTPRQIADRISATHTLDFLPNYETYNANPGALPTTITNGVSEGTSQKRLMHPFVIDANLTRVIQSGLAKPGTNIPTSQCPGSACPSGTSCDVNQCVTPAGVHVPPLYSASDDLAGIGFREQRDIQHDGDSWYGVDLLYTRLVCVPGGTTTNGTQAVCQ